MGFLVHSFNDMTKRLRRARAEATHSQQAVERERERLAIILARLSTGVLAIDRSMTVRTASEAAGAILGTDVSAASGRSLPELAAGNARLGQFVAALAVRFAGGREEWREQLDLDGAAGRRTLMCACPPLPGEDADTGFVIVFDDITTLLQAQRDAAWGEVARRSEEHTSELQSQSNLVCRLLLEKKNQNPFPAWPPTRGGGRPAPVLRRVT